MNSYGVVVSILPERHYGLVWPAEGNASLPFLYKDFLGAEKSLRPPLPVTFVTVPHPRDPKRRVARDVRPAELASIPGEISWLGRQYGFVRLANGQDAYFHWSCTVEKDLRPGQTVECVVVPGKPGRMFTLSLRLAKQPEEGSTRRVPGSAAVPCGAGSQRGRRTNKAVNDDSFLVDRLPGGLWLLAVADGVSKPSYGWWASDKCIELLWRSSQDFAPRLLENRASELEVMNDWIRSIHEDFLTERRRQSLADYQSATTTLTFAVVQGLRVLFANSGDSPLYRFHRKTGRLKGLIENLWSRSRGTHRGQAHLSQHMAAGNRDWRPLVNAIDLDPGDLVVLCSDGVASGDRSREKHDLLNRTLGDDRRDLQQRVTDVLAQIAELGEVDDLTLLAFKPEDAQ